MQLGMIGLGRMGSNMVRRLIRGGHQCVVREAYTLKPCIPFVEYTDTYGNLCQRLIAPPGEFSIRTSADVLTPDAIEVSPGAAFDEV